MPAPLVIFDLDGTLLDTAPDLLRALNTVLVEQGLAPVDRAAVEFNFGHGAKALILEGFRRAGRPLAPEATEPLVLRFLELYGSGYAIDTRPFPGALAAMDRLARRGVRLAVCTNKRAHLAVPLLAALGLDRHFAAVIGGVHIATGFVSGASRLEDLMAQSPTPALALLGIRIHAAVVPAAIMLICTILFWILYDLTPEKVAENRRKLEEMEI